jgi:hypothetical protein
MPNTEQKTYNQILIHPRTNPLSMLYNILEAPSLIESLKE